MSSWGGLWGLHEAAHQKKWHGFCNWCDWNAGPVPWVDLQKQRLQHAYDTGGDPNSPEGQGGHVSVVSDVPHPLSLVDGKRYPITYVPFRPGDETAQAVRARYPGVAVMHNGDHIGQVEWHPEDHPTRGSEVSWIDVDPEYQRHGIATSLFDWAKEHVNPALHHSDYQTAQGEEWLNHLGSADGIRYAAVVDADVAEDMRRLAMPAPMPEGITFHYHPTNDTIPTKPWPPDPDIYAPSFSAPAVEARHHGQTIGFLEWDPPLHSTTIDGVQYGDYPPEISMIKVHRDYRRHGVATAMFDFARRHQGDLNHSPEKTAQGEAWAGYEQSRTTRLAMPAPTSLRFTSEDHEAWHDQERLNDIYTKRRQMQRDYERRTKVPPGTIIGRRVVARAPWNPAGGPLWRGMRVRWSPEELVRLHELHDSDDHETLAHTILDRVQHGSTVGEWHQPREGRGGLGVFWSGSPDVSRAYSHHGDGHDPGEAGPFENVVVQTDGYAPADEWTPYDEDVPHDWEPNDFLNADRETDLREGAPLGVTHVHVNAPGGPLSIPLTRPRRMTATFPNRDADGDPSTAQRHALAQMLHLQHYAQNGVHPKIGGFDPGETVATHPAAHHPLMTNHWAAEVMHPQPVSGPFGLRVQGSTGRYVNALIGVHQNGPQHDGGGTGRRLEDASNELRVELQHSDHISVPDLSEFSPLVVPGHANLLAAVNPRFDHGLPGNNSAARAAYQTNCQRAVLALDARHRGLNVEARPNFHEPGNPLSDEQWTDGDLADFWRDGKNHPATWIDAEDHFQFTPPGPGWWDAMDEEIASWGPQARALVAVTQADPNNPGVPARHVIYAHGSRRGKVNYADPQIAKADASDWRDRVLYGGHPLLFTTQQRNEAAARTNNPHAQKIVRNRLYSPLRFMRIDDKNLDPRAARHLVDRGTAGHRPIVPWPASSMIVQ